MGTAWRPLFFDGDRFCFILLGVSVPGRLAVFLHVFARPSASGLHTAKANNVISKDSTTIDGVQRRIECLRWVRSSVSEANSSSFIHLFLHSSVSSLIYIPIHLFLSYSAHSIICSFILLFNQPEKDWTGEQFKPPSVQSFFCSIVLLFNRSFVESFFCSIVLLFSHCSTILLLNFLLFNRSFVQSFSCLFVLLFNRSTVLLFNRSFVQLFSWSIVLLFNHSFVQPFS